jgi:pimeloyl-ACP methyl ester carboxylesterase
VNNLEENHMHALLRLLAISMVALSANLHASDLAKEKRWADQVVDSIMDGEAVWLNDGAHDFLGIYTGADEDRARAVVVMHGIGIHPNWQQVILPLRVELAAHNWSTLSIQMPVLANEAELAEYAPLFDEVAPRIDAAIGFLKANGAKEVVLIGHSLGAAMAAYYLSASKRDVQGFVAIGMAGAGDPRMNGVLSLEKITLPVLDIYGGEDLEGVLANTRARTTAAQKAGNSNFTQVEVAGSNHFFDGREDELVEAVAAWLEELPGN